MVKSLVFLYKTDISDTHLPVMYFLERQHGKISGNSTPSRPKCT